MNHSMDLNQDMLDRLNKLVDSQQREIGQLCDCLHDVLELVEDYVDIDNNGGPNLAMRVSNAIKPTLLGE